MRRGSCGFPFVFNNSHAPCLPVQPSGGRGCPPEKRVGRDEVRPREPASREQRELAEGFPPNTLLTGLLTAPSLRHNADMDYTGIFALLCVFIIAPTIVFSFIYFSNRGKLTPAELRIERDTLELEIEKEKAHTKAIEAESAKYDRIIESR